MTTPEMEIILAYFFDFRKNLIVPNVKWGFGLKHEADLLILYPSGFCDEIEIKVSKADLLKDKEKKHKHRSNKVRALYFAIPFELEDQIENIQENAGVYVVYNKRKVILKRPARVNGRATKATKKDREHLYHLAAMRIWNLKRKLYIKKKK